MLAFEPYRITEGVLCLYISVNVIVIICIIIVVPPSTVVTLIQYLIVVSGIIILLDILVIFNFANVSSHLHYLVYNIMSDKYMYLCL